MPTEAEYRVFVNDTLELLAEIEIAALTDAVIDDDLTAAIASQRIEGVALLGEE